MSFRIGYGYDVHALAEGETLWLGGVKINHYKGTVAHSDGDVLIHAICDAMLGALALGDIGTHFPDNDQNYKGISSISLLKMVYSLVKEKGYTLGNVDSTIAAQKPKLFPIINQMRYNLAEALGESIDKISIKATTTEKLGFEGEELGISSYAVVLIKKEDE